MNKFFFAVVSVVLFALQSVVSQSHEKWTPWSACSHTCGIGISKRLRICHFPYVCSSMYRRIQIRSCYMKSCQDYCGQWTSCSSTCGYGTRTRRNCFTKELENSSCFSPCQQVCDNSIIGLYRPPSSPCCDKDRMANATCGRSSILPTDSTTHHLTDQKISQKVFPWTVKVKVGTKTCLGAIINDMYVITSAKCVYRKYLLSITVVAGQSTVNYHFDRELKFERDVQFRAVQKVIIYPRFDHQNYAAYNIALLRLRKPLKFVSDYIAPICLPQGEQVPDGSKCVAFDFLPTTKTIIGSNLQLLPMDDCIRSLGSYKIGMKKAALQITNDRTVCAGQMAASHYSCQGTPGSALMCQQCSSSCKWLLYGVTSYGDKRCTTVKRPGVFAKIAFFEPWILKVMGKKSTLKTVTSSCEK